MKPFNLELAKSGHPVCTRSGRDARIVCFDARPCNTLVVLVADNICSLSSEIKDRCYFLNSDGSYYYYDDDELDLFMKECNNANCELCWPKEIRIEGEFKFHKFKNSHIKQIQVSEDKIIIHLKEGETDQ
jgi:hypothetical protein